MDGRDVLLGAADYLEEHGWCRRRYQHGARRCVDRALWEVSGAQWSRGNHTAYRAATGRLDRLVGDRVSWNDNKAKNCREVVAVLRRAAEEPSSRA